MNIKRLSATAALATLLSLSTGCALVDGSVSTQTKIANACQGYASLLSTLALNKDQLSAGQVETVDRVRSVANPICTDLDNVDDPQAALSVLREATRELSKMETSDES